MVRILGLLILQILLMESAHGASQPTGKPGQLFFKGAEISTDEDFFTEKDAKAERLSGKVADAIISNYGMSVQNAKMHGMKQNEYLYRKARTIFPVKYLDIDVNPSLFSSFKFDIIFSNGSEFFSETKPERIEGCKGRVNSNGVVKVDIDGCIKNHYATFGD